ncbi:MAG: hypothetical protein Q9169_008378 [Polycauliona sp. 2 TL-2023]
MSPLSILKTLPLFILLTLPTSTLSSPSPAPSPQDAPPAESVPPQTNDTTKVIAPTVKILAAELNSSRTDVGNAMIVESIMNLTITGLEPGNFPIPCIGNWTFNNATEKMTYAALACEDPAVEVGVNQVAEEHPGIEIALGVSVE